MMVHSAQDQGWEGSLHLIPSVYPLMALLILDSFTDLVKTFKQDHLSFVVQSAAHIFLNY